MPNYFVGVAAEDITPSESEIDRGVIYLSGYADRLAPAEGVDDAISARALSIADNSGNCIVLATIDVAAVEASFTVNVRARVAASRGLDAGQLMINISHTHSSPAARNWPTFAVGRKPFPSFLRLLEDQTVAAIEHAIDGLRPAEVAFARGSTDIGSNRHSPKARSEFDHTLDVLCATAPDGATVAVAFFHGCHPVCCGLSQRISADFPGAARARIEETLGGTALFFQGYGGTVDPLGDRGPNLPIAVGRRLADDVNGLLAGPKVQLRGPVRAKSSTVNLPLRTTLEHAALESLAAGEDRSLDRWADLARWASLILDKEAAGTVPGSIPTELQSFRIGAGSTAWRLVASGHEVVTEYADSVRALWPYENVSLAGYSNEVRCYQPDRFILNNPPRDFPYWSHNYEGCESVLWYGLPAQFADGVEAAFVGGCATLDSSMANIAVPCAVVMPSEAVSVFARGADGDLQQVWQPAAGGAWSRAVTLGTVITGRPSVVVGFQGALAAFARGAASEVVHVWQVAAGGKWMPPVSLGGTIAGDPVAVAGPSGAIALFGRGPSGDLLHARQTAPGDGWTGWSSLGGGITGDPVAVVLPAGSMAVFGRGPGGDLKCITETTAGNGWKDWVSLGGEIVSEPAIALGVGGAIAAFARGPEGDLQHTWQTLPGNGWADWISLGGEITGAPAAIVGLGGAIGAFACGLVGDLQHTWQTGPGSGWAGWVSLGGQITGTPSVVSGYKGALGVFARSRTAELSHTWQLAAGGGWAEWVTLAP